MKGIEGHQIVLDPETNKLLVFGGIHDVSEENNIFFSLEQDGRQFTILNERQITNKRSQESPKKLQLQKTNSMMISVVKSQNSKEGKGKGDSRFFLETGIERRFYKKEFVLTDEKLKQNYRMKTKESEAMKNSLYGLGLFSSHSDFMSLISEQRVREMAENAVHFDGGEISGRQKGYVKDVKRPCSREGHCWLMVKDRLFLLGGMRHTLAFSDVLYVSRENLRLLETSEDLEERDVVAELGGEQAARGRAQPQQGIMDSCVNYLY
jgi:hypothetical protein